METAFDQQSLTMLIVGASAKIDTLWQIFIALHFGVFTLLLFNKSYLRFPGKVIAIAGYAAMLTINYGALNSTYNNLNGLQQQFRKDFGTPSKKFVPILRKNFLEVNLSNRTQLLYATHGAALALVSIIIFFGNFLVNNVRQEEL